MLLPFLTALVLAEPFRERVLFDNDWRFALGNAADPVKDFGFGLDKPWSKAGETNSAAGKTYDDFSWREVTLPHDWAVELPFIHENYGELTSHGYKPTGRKYPDTTVGWYRKRFQVPAGDKGKRISLEFDGVFRDCLVWVNGHLVARNEGGYIGFSADITDFLNYGSENTLAVRVDASHYEGWFYEGCGIYRHTWLVTTNPVHIPQWGTFVKAEPKKGFAEVSIEQDLANDSDKSIDVHYQWSITDPSGKPIAKTSVKGTVPGWETSTKPIKMKVVDPVLWSVDEPRLYTLTSQILTPDGTLLDQMTTKFGIRSFKFDKDKGFFLNGKPLKIKGVCCHQDHAGVGSALPDRLQYFRIEKLKEFGVNAYRASHNPPTPELLNACDELGMLVMDENRLIGASHEVLSQVERLVKRDRNHPSVIIWSIGNEEPEQASRIGGQIGQTMARFVKRLDDSRPVSYASNGGNHFEGINQFMDIRGFNYIAQADIDKYHKDHPTQPLYGSEEASTVSTRGEYVVNATKGYLTAYDKHEPGWGALAEAWTKFYMSREFLAGAFVWTGFDYRGEPTPYAWPCISSHFGILDTCGFFKDNAYYYQAWWTNKPTLHLLPHWNWAGSEGKPIEVWCHTNMDSVKLSLNGRDLGTKKVEKFGHLEWMVPYESGVLEAIGFKDGHEEMRTKVETTGAPAMIQLIPDREKISGDGRDISIVTVRVLDQAGKPVPIASDRIEFEVSGPGAIIGVGNGDPSCHQPDQFFSEPVSLKVKGWQKGIYTGTPGICPDISKYSGIPVDISGVARGMAPNTSNVFWTKFSNSDAAGMTTLRVGQIDDVGEIYLNGKLLGNTNDWNQSFTYDVREKLLAENTLIVVVHNRGGDGGLGRGVSLSGGVKPKTHPYRSLFNGLAQVIVQSRGKGPIELTAKANGLKSAVVTIWGL